MKLNCLIVDDEELAQRVVEKYVGDVSSLNLIKKCNNAVEAMEAIHENNIDLLFLDINMPKISGLNFLRGLKNPPMVIITTAYREYALEGYELDVIDYLKKPFSFERFFNAVNKAISKAKSKNNISENNLVKSEDSHQINDYGVLSNNINKTKAIALA